MAAALLNRRRLALCVLTSSAALLSPLARGQSRLERPQVTIAVGGLSALHHLPLTLADQLGFFKAEGLQVDIQEFSSGARAMQAAVNGVVDVVSGAFEHTLSLQAKGLSYQAFALQTRSPQIALGVSRRNLPDYKSPADLRGKIIGVPAPGSAANLVTQRVLAQAGLRAEEVSYIGVGSAAGALAALRTGQIDAMANLDPVMTSLEQKGEIRIIADTRNAKGALEVFGGTMPAACLYTSQDFVQKHPATTQALTDALVRALKWLQTAGASEVLKAVPEAQLLGDRALYLAAFDRVRESFSADGLMPDDGPRTALRALAQFDSTIRADKVELGRLYTNEFSKKAKLRYKA